MERIRHECTANDRGHSIEYYHLIKLWYLKALQDCVVYHCPYCGLKLEPPVKIEVSRKVLDTWHAELHRAHQVLIQDLGRLRADSDVLAVLNQMAALLND